MSTSYPFSLLNLSSDEQRVCALLQKQRQCTSAELISKAGVSNPNAVIDGINQQLLASHSQWFIQCSATRSLGRQSVAPVGYYRLLRKLF
ncbi:hypothetical protein [Iodobacter ciconiae]|uniref:Uncharacterized protein n=1 Tax=Iodobacter ciconiae TaxID=2496266 RepID=A0A3S8ZSP3_9NEIS|nr:hypothetical protein [Iodobacter ciconiae]AZN36488.1 hypothetical protein EJO50_08265 [Iodobacter ciconiae]